MPTSYDPPKKWRRIAPMIDKYEYTEDTKGNQYSTIDGVEASPEADQLRASADATAVRKRRK